MNYDPGDQNRGKSKRPGVRAPEAPNLFDTSDQPPPTPFQVKSATSIDAAKAAGGGAMSKRRMAVLRVIERSNGLARFQVASMLHLPDHWLSSSVDALIKMRKVEESGATVINPASGKPCAVLVAIVAAEESAA